MVVLYFDLYVNSNSNVLITILIKICKQKQNYEIWSSYIKYIYYCARGLRYWGTACGPLFKSIWYKGRGDRTSSLSPSYSHSHKITPLHLSPPYRTGVSYYSCLTVIAAVGQKKKNVAWILFDLCTSDMQRIKNKSKSCVTDRGGGAMDSSFQQLPHQSPQHNRSLAPRSVSCKCSVMLRDMTVLLGKEKEKVLRWVLLNF